MPWRNSIHWPVAMLSSPQIAVYASLDEGCKRNRSGMQLPRKPRHLVAKARKIPLQQGRLTRCRDRMAFSKYSDSASVLRPQNRCEHGWFKVQRRIQCIHRRLVEIALRGVAMSLAVCRIAIGIYCLFGLISPAVATADEGHSVALSQLKEEFAYRSLLLPLDDIFIHKSLGSQRSRFKLTRN